MTRLLSKLTLNQKLGLVALALGAVAVFADVAPARTVTVHEKDLLTSIERQEDHVTPSELAAWIVEGRADYRLVDIRDAKAYAEYHIPTAENLPLSSLADGSLGRTEKIVLYGDGGIHAAQAWMVLKGKGHTAVSTLLEGLDAWKDQVLFPVLEANATPQEQARFERAAAVAKFFGGAPRAGAGAELATSRLPELPKLESSDPATAPPGGAPARRKKKEGC